MDFVVEEVQVFYAISSKVDISTIIPNDTCIVVWKDSIGKKLNVVFLDAVSLVSKQKETLFNEIYRFHYVSLETTPNLQEEAAITHSFIEQQDVSYADLPEDVIVY